MPPFTRRSFVCSAAAFSFSSGLGAGEKALRIGVTDWNLDLGANPAAVKLASELGFDGVQVSFGRRLIAGKLPVDNSEVIQHYRAESQKWKLPIDGTCVDRLHDNGLKNDPLAFRWVEDSIRLTKELGVQVLLLPFFGPRAMNNRNEMDRVADALREIAPKAETAEVILGLEDTISAEDNVRIMDRSRSKNVLVYYDVGNSTQNGFDVVKEIRWLGKDRICQIHLKDNPYYLGQGKIQFGPVIQAIHDIGFTGYANLETDVPKTNLAAGLRKNLQFVRTIVSRVYES